MYVPLNIKTDNSLQSSMISINKLISFALNNSIKALTITDNNMYGVIDFYKACKKNNIKPIIGLDININDKHIILYAKSYIGYLNFYNIRDDKPISIGKGIKIILPYFIIINITWILILIGWYIIGLPIGPGVYPTV